MKYKKLVSFIFGVRFSNGNDVLTNSFENNFGIEGFLNMVDSVYDTSTHKGKGEYGYEFCIKLDSCDKVGIDFVNNGLNSTQKKFIRYTITDRGTSYCIKKNIDPQPADMGIDHIWLTQAYNISKPSRYYWIWNHGNIMRKNGWDEYIHENNQKWYKPWTDHHINSGNGVGTMNIFPLLHHDLIKERGTIAGKPVADSYWEDEIGGISSLCDMNLDVKLLEESHNGPGFWDSDFSGSLEDYSDGPVDIDENYNWVFSN